MNRSTPLKTCAFVLATAFAVSPLAFAGDKYQKPSAQQTQYRQQQTGRAPMGASDQQNQDQAMTATVENIDQQKGRITLRSSDGNTVELQVPESMLSDLQSGDSVEVSIRKADDDQKHGIGGQRHGLQEQQGSSQSGR